MRRTLVAFAVLLVALMVAGPAVAQNTGLNSTGLNFNDQRAVEAEINRRVEEMLKARMPDYEEQKRKAAEYEQRTKAMMPQGTPPAAQLPPTMTCEVGGCNKELCMPQYDGISMPGQGLSACQRLTFYDCYKAATCGIRKLSDGSQTCGWQETGELRNCLQQNGGKVGLAHAGFKP